MGLRKKCEKMNIAICDDDSTFRSTFRDNLEKLLRQTTEYNIDEYSSGEEFIEGCDSCNYDCVFLDLYMGGMTGFETASQLARKNKDTRIVFLTSNVALVYDSFEYQPFYFLRKDNYVDVLPKVIQKLKILLAQNGIFILGGRSDNEHVSVGSICYITSDKHNITIQTTKYCYDMRKTMAEAEKELVPYGFVRIHKQYLVNLRYVKKVSTRDDTVVMYDDVVLEMSRRNKSIVMEKFREYQRSMNNI